jgi:hypothetical protein
MEVHSGMATLLCITISVVTRISARLILGVDGVDERRDCDCDWHSCRIIRTSLETPDSGLSPHSLSEEDGDNMRGRPVRKHCDVMARGAPLLAN